MKQLNIIGIFALLLFASFNSGNKKSVITVNLDGYKEGTPIYYYVTNPYWILDLPDTVYADANGHLKVEISLKTPQVFLLYCSQDKSMFRCPMILIKPGEEHLITCKLTKDYNDKNAASISGPNSDGQMLFSTIDDGVRTSFETSSFKDKWDLSKPETLIDSFNIKTEKAILPYRQLYQAKKIDKAFYDYAKNYINYYFAYQLALATESAIQKESLPNKKDEYKKINDYIFNIYPGPKHEILNSSVIDDYMYYYNLNMKRRNLAEYEANEAKGLKQTYELNNAKKVLSNEAYKYYAISYLMSYSGKKDLETLDLFENYKLEYPGYTKNRAYQRLENKSIPEIKEFYAQKNITLPEGVIFLDKDKPFNSFNELITYFTGKYVFIDCWATWCGPCISQFEYANPLKEFLKANKIEILYLALENDESRDKVEIFCKKYNLTGYHIVANKIFQKDFNKKFEIKNIPRYILIDKKGDIAIRETLFPSKKEELYDQIKSIINK
jgi:thiol-disulfide isomerase/thioredoxin